MKRLLSLTTFLLLIASCTSEVDQMVNRVRADFHGDDEVFLASVEAPAPDTKVFADENMKVLWNADDRIAIFNKYTYGYQYRFAGEDGATAGAFKKVPNGDSATGDPLDLIYAVYPFNDNLAISNSGVLSLSLPPTQSYKENSFGIGANTMISVSEGNNLSFKNLGGYIAIRLYGDNIAVSRITIRGNKGEKIAGKAAVTMTMGEVPETTMDASSATDAVSIVCDPAVKIGGSPTNATDFWFVIPPTTFTEGFEITVVDDMGGKFQKKTTKNFTVKRNRLDRMSALNVEPVYDDEHYAFKDANFKAYCMEHFDKDDDGILSAEEAAAVAEIDICTDNITSLKGVELFINLKRLTCVGSDTPTKGSELVSVGALDSLDLTQNIYLEELDCRRNRLKKLFLALNTELADIICDDNPLEEIICNPKQVFRKISKPDGVHVVFMKKTHIPKTSFPDPVFRNYIFAHFDTDGSGDLSETELDDIVQVEISTANVTSLKGMEWFHNLKTLSCRGESKWQSTGKLTGLNLRWNTLLEKLDCSRNQLSTLDLSCNTALMELNCSNNALKIIDLSTNERISILDCSRNNLAESLDLNRLRFLTEVKCGHNKIPLLTLASDYLKIIHCEENLLTSLRIHNPSHSLEELVCSHNKLYRIDLPYFNKLNRLVCHSNYHMTELSLSAWPELTVLDCSGCSLSSLDLANNKLLIDLKCDNNPFTTLDLSPATSLRCFSCTYRQNYSGVKLSEIRLGKDPEILLYDKEHVEIKYVGDRIISFGDNCFKKQCLGYDTDGDGEISKAEALAVTSLNITTDYSRSLKGIEEFENLRELVCRGSENHLVNPNADEDGPDEERTDIGSLEYLDLSQNTKLAVLDCSRNQLRQLDLTNNALLEFLDCSHNIIKSLDVTRNSKLKTLGCEYNDLTNLDITRNIHLETLEIPANIKSLDASNCPRLRFFQISDSIPPLRPTIVWLDSDVDYSMVESLEYSNGDWVTVKYKKRDVRENMLASINHLVEAINALPDGCLSEVMTHLDSLSLYNALADFAESQMELTKEDNRIVYYAWSYSDTPDQLEKRYIYPGCFDDFFFEKRGFVCKQIPYEYGPGDSNTIRIYDNGWENIAGQLVNSAISTLFQDGIKHRIDNKELFNADSFRVFRGIYKYVPATLESPERLEKL